METMDLIARPGFPNGLTVPMEAFDLFTELDLRGLLLSDLNGSLRISRKDANGPPEFTSDDRESIKRWKLHLLALVAYCAPDTKK